MASFVEFEIETDEEELIEKFNTAMEAAFPGWASAPGNYEDWLARSWARMAVETAELAADVPAEIFHQFGEVILNVPPIAAAAATALVDWVMVDTAGYTIEAGTLVSIAITGDESIGFTVEEDIVIAPASDTAEDVTLVAVEPGEYPNGADGVVTLIDAVPNVDSITIATAASGGADAEDPSDYLDRLASEAQLLAPRPIIATDAEVLARRISGVHRALALDTYDAVLETYDNEKTVTVVVADEDGEACSSGVKTEVEELLEAKREINFVFYVEDPTYTIIDVEFEITVHSGYTQADVEADVVAALEAYLDPSAWGSAPFSDGTAIWRDIDKVYLNEVIARIDTVGGVDRVVAVTMAEDGGGLTAADVTLNAPAALTRPGTIAAA